METGRRILLLAYQLLRRVRHAEAAASALRRALAQDVQRLPRQRVAPQGVRRPTIKPRRFSVEPLGVLPELELRKGLHPEFERRAVNVVDCDVAAVHADRCRSGRQAGSKGHSSDGACAGDEVHPLQPGVIHSILRAPRPTRLPALRLSAAERNGVGAGQVFGDLQPDASAFLPRCGGAAGGGGRLVAG